ncbi:MAG: FAD-dependent oxidoreductase [Bryobacteraceae bacterium]|nr:FAD-dependent oxidoreductase [Bryobacteraceae bacterium]
MSVIAASPTRLIGRDTGPEVVIVGGGLAGLTAAYHLGQAGIGARIYEASKRTGGRVLSARGYMGEGLVTELGGEFIDSDHFEMLGYAKQFGLELIDTDAPSEKEVIANAFYFGGTLYTEAQLTEAVKPLLPAMKRDARKAQSGALAEYDRMSLEQYLDRIQTSGWVRSVIEAAYVTEYGLDLWEQTALNLLLLAATEAEGTEWEPFGTSDERYKIRGGNQRIPEELTKLVEDRIVYEHRLEAVTQTATGYRLSFEGPTGTGKEIEAGVVVLALPFSILRRTALRVAMPAAKKRAIHELGYGHDAKLFFGVERRVWRERGYSGNLFSDEPFQLAWDSSRMQAGDRGSVTMLIGGRRGLELGARDPEHHVERLLPSLVACGRGWVRTEREGGAVSLADIPVFMAAYSWLQTGAVHDDSRVGGGAGGEAAVRGRAL